MNNPVFKNIDDALKHQEETGSGVGVDNTVTLSKHKLEEWGAWLFQEGFMCAKDKEHATDAYGISRRDNAVAKKLLEFFPKPKPKKKDHGE